MRLKTKCPRKTPVFTRPFLPLSRMRLYKEGSGSQTIKAQPDKESPRSLTRARPQCPRGCCKSSLFRFPARNETARKEKERKGKDIKIANFYLFPHTTTITPFTLSLPCTHLLFPTSTLRSFGHGFGTASLIDRPSLRSPRLSLVSCSSLVCSAHRAPGSRHRVRFVNLHPTAQRANTDCLHHTHTQYGRLAS